jgi:N-acetylneuraminate lyase
MPPDPLHLRGLVAPAFTPMRADGSLDLAGVERQAAHLVAQGVAAVFVCGTTGEGPSLTVPERQQLVERWCAVTAAAKSMPVIAHVGDSSIAAAKQLAEHAQGNGAAAIAAVPPHYFRPSCVDDVVACATAVASAAPRVPFYYYHIPGNTAVRVPMAELLELGAARIPTLAGLKFSDDDLMDFGQCVALAVERYDLFYGRDEMLLPALSVGARAAIGTTYNFAAPLYRRMIDSFHQGDLATAQALQARSRDLVSLIQRHGGLPAMKAAMQLAGADCGPCRLPLRTLDEQQIEALGRDLDEARLLAVIRPEGFAAR